ncbi:MAG: epoxyqueuosine reductase QueH [Hungatella sp.]|nr:epoxyqueuosine reductase QueH [Hungatella sp.]
MDAACKKTGNTGNRNYQKELDKLLEKLNREGRVPRLLLHSCCAPCSSYVLEYLSRYFEITVLYYNPNIYPPKEYEMRVKEEEGLIARMPFVHKVTMLEGRYEPAEFYETVKGLEKEPEGGKRCEKCYELRLKEAARAASEGGFDYFTTTLTISPLKPAGKLNDIGEKLGEEYKVAYLSSDFKKRDGYKRSLELSKEYDLYRQNYCGCIYSIRT